MSFLTADGVVMKGVYSPPAEPGGVTLVLLHGLGSTKAEWGSFEAALSKAGYGWLAYDARGHGESRLTVTGARTDYEAFGPGRPGSPWERMVEDLGAAVNWLEGQGLARERVGVAGASLGANVALAYAARHREAPVAILLSPGLEYAGIGSEAPMGRMAGRRVAVVASPGDVYAYRSSQRLCAGGRAAFFTEAGSGHGVQMFGKGLEQRLLRWLKGERRKESP